MFISKGWGRCQSVGKMSIGKENKNNLELYGTTFDYGSNSDYMQETHCERLKMQHEIQRSKGVKKSVRLPGILTTEKQVTSSSNHSTTIS